MRRYSKKAGAVRIRALRAELGTEHDDSAGCLAVGLRGRVRRSGSSRPISMT